MKLYTIRTLSGNSVLFSGYFQSMRDCLGAAVRDNIPLHYADLRGLNLLNAELDGADLRHASFSGSNLCGANISEAILDHANFRGTVLYGTVLCDSSMKGCDFTDAVFGATEISGADLSECLFSTLSTFDLRFKEARRMQSCCFINACGTLCPMTQPPVVIHGLSRILVLMDRHFKLGSGVFEPFGDLTRHRKHISFNPLTLRLRLEQIAALKFSEAA